MGIHSRLYGECFDRLQIHLAIVLVSDDVEYDCECAQLKKYEAEIAQEDGTDVMEMVDEAKNLVQVGDTP
jgi:hypothetical protein